MTEEIREGLRGFRFKYLAKMTPIGIEEFTVKLG